MQVSVRIQGVLGDLIERIGGDRIHCQLPDAATAGDLIEYLAGNVGEPFSEYRSNLVDGLPAAFNLFLNGEHLASPHTPLAPPNGGPTAEEKVDVRLIIVKPISGG